MRAIRKVEGREIIDSRGNPTVEVFLTSGAWGRASLPSIGIQEVVEFRGSGSCFNGKVNVNNKPFIAKKANWKSDIKCQKRPKK